MNSFVSHNRRGPCKLASTCICHDHVKDHQMSMQHWQMITHTLEASSHQHEGIPPHHRQRTVALHRRLRDRPSLVTTKVSCNAAKLCEVLGAPTSSQEIPCCTQLPCSWIPTHSGNQPYPRFQHYSIITCTQHTTPTYRCSFYALAWSRTPSWCWRQSIRAPPNHRTL